MAEAPDIDEKRGPAVGIVSLIAVARRAAAVPADRRHSPTKSSFVRGFSFEPGKKEALLAFLRSLTDVALPSDPRFFNPWPTQ